MSEIVSWPQVDGRGLAPRPGFPVLPQVGREGRAATLQPHWSACTWSGRGRAGEEPASDTWPRPWPGHAPPSRSARGVKPAENTWLLTSPRMRAKAENSPNALDLTLRFGKDNGQWESKKKKKIVFLWRGRWRCCDPGSKVPAFQLVPSFSSQTRGHPSGSLSPSAVRTAVHAPGCTSKAATWAEVYQSQRSPERGCRSKP